MKAFHHFLQYPISSSLLLFYIFISVIQGNFEVFLAGLFAAVGAFGLEFKFHVTGAIGMQRARAGRNTSNTGRNLNPVPDAGHPGPERPVKHRPAGKAA